MTLKGLEVDTNAKIISSQNLKHNEDDLSPVSELSNSSHGSEEGYYFIFLKSRI